MVWQESTHPDFATVRSNSKSYLSARQIICTSETIFGLMDYCKSSGCAVITNYKIDRQNECSSAVFTSLPTSDGETWKRINGKRFKEVVKYLKIHTNKFHTAPIILTDWHYHSSKSRRCSAKLYTQNQWKRNFCIFEIFPTWTCQSKLCFHQTVFLYIFYQKIILCIDWLSIYIV